MLKIGNVRLKNPLVLAPMAGVTNLAFRKLVRRYGAGLAFSEMIDADGMFYDIHRYKKEFRTDADDNPVACQLFGARSDTMSSAAKMLEGQGASIIDLNLGCPSFKLSRKNAGALVSSVDVPVTAKIRTGWDDSVSVLESAHVVEDAGASAVTVHARTAKMMYSGDADWGVIKQVKDGLKIPVIGNGDVNSPSRAKEMFDKTGCDFVMIGRAALGNPFIFKDCLEFLESGKVAHEHTKEERQRALLELWELCRETGEARLSELRMHACWFSKGLTGGRRFREEVGTKKTVSELEGLIEMNFC